MAPELLRNPVPGGSFAGDVFSFSIIIQEVITRSLPYSMMDMPARGEAAACKCDACLCPPVCLPVCLMACLPCRNSGASEEAPSAMQTCGFCGRSSH